MDQVDCEMFARVQRIFLGAVTLKEGAERDAFVRRESMGDLRVHRLVSDLIRGDAESGRLFATFEKPPSTNRALTDLANGST
jgi:hypothetical protein